MGIKGIYQEIGPGERIALSKLAVDTFESKGRPFRLAIDISIWLFQMESGQGGTNPALRTFYYRILRILSHNIHPLFVFDGPNKPPFKRNKRTGPNVKSIPEYLTKQLLKSFGLPFHIAPGEAEAECAVLQRIGVVDAVLSEDVDTLMFGSGLTLRNWSAGTPKGQVATHVNIHHADKTKAACGLDREGMILVALMSGGDYNPEGIPKCGPKTACEAARAGFGRDLCQLDSSDDAGWTVWKDRLTHELRTNESGFFRSKHKGLIIPEDFPRRDLLRYYAHPCVTSEARLTVLGNTWKWDQDIDFAALRTFTGEAFDWLCISGAKKFIRNLAPVLLIRSLRLRGEDGSTLATDAVSVLEQQEAALVRSIHGRRSHHTTDDTPELRIGYVPSDLVPINLENEDPDPELPLDGADSEADLVAECDNFDENGNPVSPRKKRGPPTFDPAQLEKIWIVETYVKLGVPLKAQDWESSTRIAAEAKLAKARPKKPTTPKKSAARSMQTGSLEKFISPTKPGQKLFADQDKMGSIGAPEKTCSESAAIEKSLPSTQARQLPSFRRPQGESQANTLTSTHASRIERVDMLSSPPRKPAARLFSRVQSDSSHLCTTSARPRDTLIEQDWMPEPLPELPRTVTKRRRRSPLRRSHTMTEVAEPVCYMISSSPLLAVVTLPTTPSTPKTRGMTTISAQLEPESPSTIRRLELPGGSKAEPTALQTIDLLTPSPMREPATPRQRQRSIMNYMSPSPHRHLPRAQDTFSTQALEAKTFSIIRQAQEDPFQDERSAIFGLDLPRRPLSDQSLNTPSSPPQVGDINSRSKAFRLPGDVVRLRDSLPGHFALEIDHASADGLATSKDMDKKRRTRAGHDGQAKSWRLSGIELVDLTGP